MQQSFLLSFQTASLASEQVNQGGHNVARNINLLTPSTGTLRERSRIASSPPRDFGMPKL